MTVEKKKGRKRHIGRDTLGCILAVKVHKTNIHDTKSGIFHAISAYCKYQTIKKFCCDGGYRSNFVKLIKFIEKRSKTPPFRAGDISRNI